MHEVLRQAKKGLQEQSKVFLWPIVVLVAGKHDWWCTRDHGESCWHCIWLKDKEACPVGLLLFLAVVCSFFLCLPVDFPNSKWNLPWVLWFSWQQSCLFFPPWLSKELVDNYSFFMIVNQVLLCFVSVFKHLQWQNEVHVKPSLNPVCVVDLCVFSACGQFHGEWEMLETPTWTINIIKCWEAV